MLFSLQVSATEIVSGVSGDSEGRIRDLFNQAKALSPCLLFIDKLDVIAKRHDDAQRSMETRITNQLMISMDELGREQDPENCQEEGEQKTQAQVFVVGATSKPELIEPELRTTSRFSWLVFFLEFQI